MMVTKIRACITVLTRTLSACVCMCVCACVQKDSHGKL